MESTLASICLQVVTYLGVAALVFSAVIGSIAAISPKAFERLVRISDKRFSLDWIVAMIERPINVEHYLKPCTRMLGITALTSAIYIGLQFYSLA